MKVFENSFLYSSDKQDKLALILLNSPTLNIKLVKRIWNSASIIYFADGASNRIYDSLTDGERPLYLPDGIAGDMDSIRIPVREYYSSQGIAVTELPDQDTNDLDKCLKCISTHDRVRGQSEEWTVIVSDPFGGRLDQQLAGVHAAFSWLSVFHGIVLLGEGNVAQVIGPGASSLRLRPGVEGPHCGLFPVGSCPAVVTTSGLKWNLTGHELRMGGLVSSSNMVVKEGIIDDEAERSSVLPNSETCHHVKTATERTGTSCTASDGSDGGLPGSSSSMMSTRSKSEDVSVVIDTTQPVLWTCEIGQFFLKNGG